MEATVGDHKPVKCVFYLDITHVFKETMRQEYVEITSSIKKVLHLLQGLEAFTEFIISPTVKLQNRSNPKLLGRHCSGFPYCLKVCYCLFIYLCRHHFKML
jgi:hypothetical protein